MGRNNKFINTILLVFYSIAVIGQNQSKISITEIMKGMDFVGHQPTNIYWSENGKNIYFNWNPDKRSIPGLYQYN